MMKFRSMAAMAALGATLAMPAFAQTNSGATTNNGASTHSSMNTPAANPSPMATSSNANANNAANSNGEATYTTADNNVRASKVIGASVYNDQDQKIGTVDDLLVDSSRDVKQAVLSVGGFLGIDSKLVAVNMDRLDVKPNRIVMSGATKDGLTKMPTYKFSNAS
jgi:sporulation protein YlmC with PRC-barrel domain